LKVGLYVIGQFISSIRRSPPVALEAHTIFPQRPKYALTCVPDRIISGQNRYMGLNRHFKGKDYHTDNISRIRWTDKNLVIAQVIRFDRRAADNQLKSHFNSALVGRLP